MLKSICNRNHVRLSLDSNKLLTYLHTYMILFRNPVETRFLAKIIPAYSAVINLAK